MGCEDVRRPSAYILGLDAHMIQLVVIVRKRAGYRSLSLSFPYCIPEREP